MKQKNIPIAVAKNGNGVYNTSYLEQMLQFVEFEIMGTGKEQNLRRQSISEEELLGHLVAISEVKEQPVDWLEEGWIPKGCVTVLAGDGGIGKSTVWCSLVTKLSRAGKPCLYFSSEDGAASVVKPRLIRQGANMDLVYTIDQQTADAGVRKNIFLGSETVEMIIDRIRPCICIFDPVQSFLPAGAKMDLRTDIRKFMDQLNTLGERYGTAFLIVCHTNKKKNAYGRDRLSNSADLWDGARSVIMLGKIGFTGLLGEYCYMANEKNNYAKRQDTVVFVNDDGRILKSYTTAMTEEEIVRYRNQLLGTEARENSKVNRCKKEIEAILSEQPEQKMPIARLTGRLMDEGYKEHTVRNAKTELHEEGVIEFRKIGTDHMVFMKGVEIRVSDRI